MLVWLSVFAVVRMEGRLVRAVKDVPKHHEASTRLQISIVSNAPNQVLKTKIDVYNKVKKKWKQKSNMVQMEGEFWEKESLLTCSGCMQ